MPRATRLDVEAGVRVPLVGQALPVGSTFTIVCTPVTVLDWNTYVPASVNVKPNVVTVAEALASDASRRNSPKSKLGFVFSSESLTYSG